MATIEFITLEVPDIGTSERFYSALSLSERVRLRAADAAASGFRGFTLSLVASQPANVDSLIERATEAGATVVKPAAKSLWGYGGVLQAPDATLVTVASSSKKSTAGASAQFDDLVLQLGVADVAASKEFYVDHGFTVAKSFGRKYVEFDTGSVTLTLNSRRSLAKTVGVAEDGSGSHRMAIGTTAGPFTDPDGFLGEAPGP